MTKEKVLGILRHVLTFVGGIIVMYGVAEQNEIDSVVGGFLTLVGTVWSVINKSDKK